MTPEQKLLELRKELFANERLTSLLKDVAKHSADMTLRQTYSTADATQLVHLTSHAGGIEKFINHITETPNAARKTGQVNR